MYDESEVKAIIQRAIELDAARSATLTREELVEVAAELGISERAVNEAIVERSAQSARALRERGTFSALRVLNLGAGLGVLSGLATGVALSQLPGEFGIAGVVGGMLTSACLMMASGGLALVERGRSPARYVRRNAALWLGTAFGSAVTMTLLHGYDVIQSTRSIPRDLLNATSGLVVTTLVGAGFLLMRRRSGMQAGTGSPPPGLTARVSARVKAGFANLVARWLKARDACFEAFGTRASYRSRSSAGNAG